MRLSKRMYIVLILIAAIALTMPFMNGRAAADVGDLSIRVSPDITQTGVGDSSDLQIEVSNNGSSPTGDLSLHIDITDPQKDGSVDPVDWSPELTRSIGSIDTGESNNQIWTIKPISGGDFVFYAVILEPSAGSKPSQITTSDGVAIRVEEKRAFNPQGVTPIVIAIPAIIAVALIWRRWRFNFHHAVPAASS